MVPVSPINVVTSGDILKVNQRNHGMYSNTNFVTLSGIRPTVSPTTLTASYPRTVVTRQLFQWPTQLDLVNLRVLVLV